MRRERGQLTPQRKCEGGRVSDCSRKLIDVQHSSTNFYREALPKVGRSVGLDMGVRSRIALSDGSFVDCRQVEYRKVTDIQRRIERCKKGSGNSHISSVVESD